MIGRRVLGPLPRWILRAIAAPSLRAGREAEVRAAPAPEEGARAEPPPKVGLALGALGVVYGDIGTNPLYALQDAFGGADALARTPANLFGVLSLVFWSLVLVISVKYLTFVMRTSNEGEGGILALLALVPKEKPAGATVAERPAWIALLVLFGAALLYGDGVITPSISVLAAVEGLKTAAPATAKAVVPLTIAILVALFTAQKHGTRRIGSVFGPVMLVWFVSIALLGARQIVVEPRVLVALDPRWALSLLWNEPGHVAHVLGAVVLTIAGGEALYADMGHFGRRPIQLAWYGLVLPSLLLAYLGQGAHLLRADLPPHTSTFFAIVPSSLVVPMVLLATAATVIASQALISGAYSLTNQAVELGYFPRVRIVHTSAEQIGQTYVPVVNGVMMVACVALVAGFGASSRLAAAYGLAVSGTMAITSIAYFVVLRRRFGRPLVLSALLVGAFLVVDLGFFGANLSKFFAGGWVPVGLGVAVYLLMTTWTKGRHLLARTMADRYLPLEAFVADVGASGVARVRGTGVFMTAHVGGTPHALLHHFKHNQVLHDQVVVLHVVTTGAPFVSGQERVSVRAFDNGVFSVLVTTGFFERPNVPEHLAACAPLGLVVDPARTTYYLGHETLVPSKKKKGMMTWRKQLFAFETRNAQSAPLYFGLPPNRVVELGMQIEI
ncbi:MAG: KUP/HAK/KT family potassium transporter [Labilithrix sp.]|nr:KUP/HAK/KT family potassium transporter [Labilithrix sp.]